MTRIHDNTMSNISSVKPVNSGDFSTSEMTELLAHHYGDGIVYLPAGEESSLYSIAVENGFINEEGYLTRKGRIFLAQNAEASNLS